MGFKEEAQGSFMLERSEERVMQSLAVVLSSVGWAIQACLHQGIKLGASNKQPYKGVNGQIKKQSGFPERMETGLYPALAQPVPAIAYTAAAPDSHLHAGTPGPSPAH